jgi:3-oxoadipate enol-lactonase
MSKIHVNGVNLYYEQEGTGHPLVLISGYTTDLSAWALIRHELANHFSIFMFDNRGAGRSDCPDSPYAIDTMAEDTRALIESLKLHKPYILGHSMGGAIAQTLAFKHPEAISKLILSNTLIRIHAAPAFSLGYFFKMRSQGMPRITMLEGLLPWLFSGNFLKNEQQISEFMKLAEEYPYSQTVTGQKSQLEAILQFDSETWFKKIPLPTLVIAGDEDILCPADSKRLAEGIPGAQLVTFSDQAHMAYREKPREFVNAILQFLKE